MKLKKFIPIYALIFMVIWAVNSIAGQKIDMETGDYLSEPYIEKLLKTKSPKAAESVEGTIAMVSKAKTTEDKYVIAAGNFSDGYGEIHITPEGKLNKKTSVNRSFPENPVQIINKKKFVMITPPPSSRITFIFVGDAYGWVSSNLLTGKYTDEKGTIYDFREEGSVLFQDKEYKYHVAIDFSEPPIVDCLYVGDMTFNFKIKDNKLTLYKMSGDEFEKISKTPSFVLTKQKMP